LALQYFFALERIGMSNLRERERKREREREREREGHFALLKKKNKERKIDYKRNS
jgi:hypothetical protein